MFYFEILGEDLVIVRVIARGQHPLYLGLQVVKRRFSSAPTLTARASTAFSIASHHSDSQRINASFRAARLS